MKFGVHSAICGFSRQIPSIISFVLGLMVAAIFSPGIINHDGLRIIEQATLGPVDDWQPAIATALVRLLLSLGLQVGQLTAAMAALTTLGIHGVAAQLSSLMNGRSRPVLFDQLFGLVVLAILLTPITALVWYLPYFGTDGWLSTVFVYISWLWLISRNATTRFERASASLGMTVLGLICVLIRPNAVVCLPALALMIAMIQWKHGWQHIVMWWMALVSGRPIILHILYMVFPVSPAYPQDQVMALDLVGIAYERPDALAQMPFTNAMLIGEEYRVRYQFGNVDLLFPWCGNPLTRTGYVQGSHDSLLHEYRTMVLKYPGTLAVVKIKAALEYFLSQHSYWHNSTIDMNHEHLRLDQNRRCAPIRNLFLFVDARIQGDPILRSVFCRHFAWLVMCGILLLATTCRRFASGEVEIGRLAILLLLPAGYYTSTLAASVAYQFRYMYPATLLVQITMIVLLLRWAYQKLTVSSVQHPVGSCSHPAAAM